ncbi:hypothetical protein JHK85_044318 [Glycine max]|nr:hypothetical protein JHK86_043654 [Glycine max]KAG4957938.1 hypothetical protein JHK85_044318 [Glycine max]
MEAAENDSVVLETTEPSSSHGSDGDDHLRQSSDVLAKGLSSMLSSVISDFDFRAQQTLQSQNHLSSVIDRLTGELDQLLEDAPLPFIMQQAAKISSVRKRVSSLNLLLKSIQGRIDNIDRMLSIGPTHGIDMSPETLFSSSPEASRLLWLDKESGQHALSASRATEDVDNPISYDIYDMILTRTIGLERKTTTEGSE